MPPILNPINYLFVIYDVFAHLVNEKHTSSFRTYLVLRSLYIKTRGISSNILWLLFRLKDKIVSTSPIKVDQVLSESLEELRTSGVTFIPSLNENTLQEVRQSFLDLPAYPVIKNQAYGEPILSKNLLDMSNKKSGKYEFDQFDILKVPSVKELITDPHTISIVSSYFKKRPVFTKVSAWWSFPHESSSEDLSNYAQLAHFDHDYEKFIKVFYYLSDVTRDTGPFRFANKTHYRKSFWSDGRLTDEQLNSNNIELKPIIGSKGTGFICDTSGYHAGTKVLSGHRLILQLEYSISRLGGSSFQKKYPLYLKPKSNFVDFSVFSSK